MKTWSLSAIAVLGLMVALTACGSHESSAAQTQEKRDNVVVGAWRVVSIGPGSGAIMSFRSDGTMRMLIPVSVEDMRNINRLPADEQEKRRTLLVVQGGQNFGNIAGTWKAMKADVIQVAFTLESEKKFDYTVRSLNKNSIELLQEGAPPMVLLYMHLPLSPN